MRILLCLTWRSCWLLLGAVLSASMPCLLHDHKLHMHCQHAVVADQCAGSLHVQICDFGLARHCGSPLTQDVVTQWYRAPELLMGASPHLMCACPVVRGRSCRSRVPDGSGAKSGKVGSGLLAAGLAVPCPREHADWQICAPSHDRGATRVCSDCCTRCAAGTLTATFLLQLPERQLQIAPAQIGG